MDDIVKQALAKWPNVPHCYGWLGLDARGNWYMRDDRTQAAGPFVQAKGSLLRHEKLIDFIHRNYEHDEAGQWFFQNGPQRVYVELESTPWALRVGDAGAQVSTHSGVPVQVTACLVDEEGQVYLATDRGLGRVHTQDMEAAADAIEQGRWVPEQVRAQDLPGRYGYVISPQAARGEANPA